MTFLCARCGAAAPDEAGCGVCGGPSFADTAGGREQMRGYRQLVADRQTFFPLHHLGLTLTALSYPLWAFITMTWFYDHRNPLALAQLPALATGGVGVVIQLWLKRRRRLPAEAVLEQRLGTEAPPLLALLRRPSFWLMLACALVALHLCGSPYLLHDLGCRPDEVRAGVRLHTLLTSMFTHASLEHVAGNCIVLGILASGVEKRATWPAFVATYLLGGVAGKLTYVALGGEAVVLVGASGAIMAIAGAHVALDPWRQFTVPDWPRLTLPALVVIPAVVVLGTGIDLVNHPEVAWTANLGGFVTGIALGGLLRLGRRRAPVRGAAMSPT
ncbi:MAG TPA: rhomboid family intramembrane serine protease [Polyangia bacterium]|jgi:membrane associated rhomboid family serine protease